MKNKSKLQKIKQQKGKTPQCPKEWLYLNEKAVTARNIAQIFAGQPSMSAHLWEEAGVVEIELEGEAHSIDMEETGLDFGDSFSNDYLAKNRICSVFLVTLAPEDYEQAKEAMQKVTAELGGYFCGDTSDFTPVVK